MQKHCFKFLPEEHLLIESFQGNFLPEEIAAIVSEKNRLPKQEFPFDFLIDVQSIETTFTLRHASTILQILSKSEHLQQIRRMAFVASEPLQVVTTELLCLHINKQTSINAKTFCSIGAALNWLNLSIIVR